jgi:hypothetical protein
MCSEALTCIVNDADRASDVVDRIGSLIKKAPPRKEVVDLNAAILEVTALTRSEAVKTGVTMGTQLAGELPRIQCDRVQLQQVMLNLIVNAIQCVLVHHISPGPIFLRVALYRWRLSPWAWNKIPGRGIYMGGHPGGGHEAPVVHISNWRRVRPNWKSRRGPELSLVRLLRQWNGRRDKLRLHDL